MIEEEYWNIKLEDQSGFDAGRSCIDNIFPIEKKLERSNKTYENLPVKKLGDSG